MVSIIGPSRFDCTPPIYDFGVEMGQALVDNGFGIVCGGKFGIMEAVCKGAHQSKRYHWGLTVGILPEADRNGANDYVDITIPTGMQFARNQAVVLSGQAVVATAGGTGTLSELALAWQYGKRVLTVDCFEGWSQALAGRILDQKYDQPVIAVNEVSGVINELKKFCGHFRET